MTEEVGGALRTFTIGERLTPHVRHRQKYVDVPVSRSRAFVFGSGRRGVDARAHTLREFVAILESLNVTQAEGYLRRGDFSRWIGDVFGDHALERELQRHERRDEKTEHTGGARSDCRGDQVALRPDGRERSCQCLESGRKWSSRNGLGCRYE